jgi:hypothetical protein
MPAIFVGLYRNVRFFVCALLLLAGAAAAGDLTDFDAALAEATAQCRVALEVLETSGPDETAAEVQRFRAAWQEIVTRFGAQRPERFADDKSFSTVLLDVDVRTVGALIIISAGRQDAARNALNGIAQTLEGMAESSTAPAR